jgi:hypothetical protein
MIDVQDLEMVIALTLCSGHLAADKPVSLMIVSDKCEAGKTSALEKFSKSDGIAYLSDATAFGLWRDFHKQIASGELRHILIPEMISPLSRNSDTVNSFISTLGSLIEEGIVEIHTGFLDAIKLKSPVTVGVIGCMPRPIFMTNKLRWEATGFISRFIVVTYKHSIETVERVFESIIKGEHLTDGDHPVAIPTEDYDVKVPETVARKAVEFARNVSETAVQDGKIYGYREAKNILRLVAANVVYENVRDNKNRLKADIHDFDIVAGLSYLFTGKFNELRINKQGMQSEN